MPRMLVTYDLPSGRPDPHAPFLRNAERNGWSRWMNMESGPPRKLPNTTLVGEFPTIEAAMAAFDRALLATSAEVRWSVKATKRYLFPHSEGGRLLSDEKKTEDLSALLQAALRRP